jgi:DNA-binding NtrC family response regulator
MLTNNHSASNSHRILIVDDDPGQRSLLDTFLKSQGFDTVIASSGDQALRLLSYEPVDMMISDVRMPGLSGLETLRRARVTNTRLPILLVTAYADIREAVGAMRDGAVNYLSKPIDLDELLANVQLALGTGKKTVAPPLDFPLLPETVVAKGPLMQTVFRDAALVAASETRVMITGETGVGKEVLADVIHAWSPRVKGPLVKVNCAAIPETLLESELFGHEKGAFTGAHQQRKGRFEEAEGGTIFLDEVSEMSPQLQAKLLRVTQDSRIRRVGGSSEILVNVRILAATNRDLEAQIRNGQFREDLYYRLNVVEINVPPLREHPEDILPLANHFIVQFGGAKARFSANVAECLQTYAWPGNVRELRNAMERAALVSRGEVILPEHLPARVRSGLGKGSPVTLLTTDPRKLEEIEQEAILVALKKHKYNRTETAKELAISRRALLYKIQRLRELGYDVDLGVIGKEEE